MFVITPLLPSKTTSPVPCEIDGINIGNVNNNTKIFLNFKFDLQTNQADITAKPILMIAAVVVDNNEFIIVSVNVED